MEDVIVKLNGDPRDLVVIQAIFGGFIKLNSMCGYYYVVKHEKLYETISGDPDIHIGPSLDEEFRIIKGIIMLLTGRIPSFSLSVNSKKQGFQEYPQWFSTPPYFGTFFGIDFKACKGAKALYDNAIPKSELRFLLKYLPNMGGPTSYRYAEMFTIWEFITHFHGVKVRDYKPNIEKFGISNLSLEQLVNNFTATANNAILDEGMRHRQALPEKPKKFKELDKKIAFEFILDICLEWVKRETKLDIKKCNWDSSAFLKTVDKCSFWRADVDVIKHLLASEQKEIWTAKTVLDYYQNDSTT